MNLTPVVKNSLFYFLLVLLLLRAIILGRFWLPVWFACIVFYPLLHFPCLSINFHCWHLQWHYRSIWILVYLLIFVHVVLLPAQFYDHVVLTISKCLLSLFETNQESCIILPFLGGELISHADIKHGSDHPLIYYDFAFSSHEFLFPCTICCLHSYVLFSDVTTAPIYLNDWTSLKL